MKKKFTGFTEGYKCCENCKYREICDSNLDWFLACECWYIEELKKCKTLTKENIIRRKNGVKRKGGVNERGENN